MKKVVRMLGLCALVALAFTSCKKNQTNSNLTFKASMPQTVSNDRTIMDNNRNLVWSNNDTIKVLHNGVNEAFPIISGQENKKTASFDATGKGEFLTDLTTHDSVYFAFYPNATFDANGATVVLSDQQLRIATAFGASFNTNTYPMFAFNTGDNFNFHSNAGILRIRLQKSRNATQTVKVGSIVLTSNNTDDPLVGEMTYSTGYVLNPVGQLPVQNSKHQVTLTCETAEELLSGEQSNPEFNFDFVLFEGALQGTFNVKVKNENGEVIGNFNAAASSGSSYEFNHTILREEIIIMPVKELDGTVVE